MPTNKLVDLTLKDFLTELASNSPAPGGGSAAALAAATGAALTSMVAGLTIGKKGYEAVGREIEKVKEEARHLMNECLRAVDDDTAAFNQLRTAFKLPKTTEAEQQLRAAAIEAATKGATEVPLLVLEKTVRLLELAQFVAARGNQHSLSDAQVATELARAAGHGAFANVAINLPGINDTEWRQAADVKSHALRKRLTSSPLRQS